ncbi:MAG: glycosyltransferase family 2 protein [Clostridia bacterium]|nr:glycosyltransferase family 2 protein [Clostridia bacterium]
MEQTEKIDILLATYNGEKYLKEQLDSILSQTYSNIQLIVSDDASCDSSKEILNEYEKKDSRVKVYYRENNIGSNANFEFLLTKVESDYYMFSDQDDVWMKDKVEKTFSLLKKKKAGLVCTDLMIVDENLNSQNITFNRKMKKLYKLKKYNDTRMVFLYNVVTGCTILSRKEYIKYILPLPKTKNVLHDHFIPLVISKYATIEYLDEPTMYYRQHANNQVGTKRYTDKFSTFDDTRNYLIDLKIDIFNTYLERKDVLSSYYENLAKDSIIYFEGVKKVKGINFKNLKTFNELYKNDKFSYRFWNSMLFNVPCVARIWYKLFM